MTCAHIHTYIFTSTQIRPCTHSAQIVAHMHTHAHNMANTHMHDTCNKLTHMHRDTPTHTGTRALVRADDERNLTHTGRNLLTCVCILSQKHVTQHVHSF
eukprot:GDKI01012972.1.p1 GENE.GDKI01012972.1~~GDKI01012972.1.p1  ORF type:complete len:100 (+),score=21.16 GDKI01012972.1:208-507(+)